MRYMNEHYRFDDAKIEYRDDLYADELVLYELAIYPPMINTVPDAPSVGSR